jgi:hypothetical protein
MPDENERRGAYEALYGVLNGIFRIAKSGIYPLNEMRHSQYLDAAVMRERQSKLRDLPNRDAIVGSMIEMNEKRARPLPVVKLLPHVNERLAGAGFKKISSRTYYRICEQRTSQK